MDLSLHDLELRDCRRVGHFVYGLLYPREVAECAVGGMGIAALLGLQVQMRAQLPFEICVPVSPVPAHIHVSHALMRAVSAPMPTLPRCRW